MGRFVEEHGLVQYRPAMRYSRTESCEIAGCSTLRLSFADKQSRSAGSWNVSDRADSPLYLDHCHAHGWIRGPVCASCNSVIRHLDKHGYLLRYQISLREEYRTHLNQCPDCPQIQLLATDYEINYAYALTLPDSWFKASIVEHQTQDVLAAARQLGMTLELFTARIRDLYLEFPSPGRVLPAV
jgi:hypothetical protein